MEDAVAGRSATLLVTGEPGAGKSRLVDQAARTAEQRGFRVLRGAASDHDGAPAHWPWIQILRGLPSADPRAGSLAALLAPADAARVESFPSSDAAELRFLLCDGIADLLARASAESPLFLGLDDLSDADPTSVQVFEFLAADVRPANWLLAASWRDPDPRRRHDGFLGRVSRHARTIHLGGLSEADVGDLVRDQIGTPAPAGVATALHRATAGNPLYLGLLLRAAEQSGSLEAAALVRAPAARLTHAIGDRLRPLSAAARSALRIGAVLGREFSLANLQRVASARRDAPAAEELLDALAEVESAQLLRSLPGSRARYAFHHGLVREAVYEEIDDAERRALHARVAAALAVESPEGTAPLAEIAHHLLCALPASDPAAVIAACRAAGDGAWHTFSYADAERHYAAALRVARAAATRDDGVELDLLLLLGAAQIRAGERARAMQTYSEAAAAARRTGRWTALADAAISAGDRGLGVTVVPADPEVEALLEEALEGAPPDELGRRARLRACLAAERSGAPGDREAPALVLEAERDARALGDPATLGYVLSHRCFVPWRRYDPAPREELAAEVARLGRTLRDPELESQGRTWLLCEHIVTGDRQRFEAALAALHALLERYPRPRYQWVAHNLGALGALWSGDWRRAEEQALAALALAQRIGDDQIAAAAWLQTFVARRERGLRPEDEGILRLPAARTPESPVPRALLALCLVDLGRDDEARLEFERLAADDFAFVEREHRFGVLPYLAEVCARLADRRRAPILARLLERLAGRNASIGNIVAFGAPEHHLALLAATVGDDDRAAALFETALQRNAAMKGEPWRLRTCLELGRLLARRGETARAAQLLEEASDGARRMAMGQVRSQAEALCAALPLAAAADAGDTHFIREGEFWAIGRPPRLVRDSVGMRHLARLLRQPGVALLALELAAGEEGSRRVDGSEGLSLRSATDEDPARLASDARAVREYRARLSAARQELEEAESFRDLGRSARLQEEVESLAAELARVAGLGRRRGASPAADRPRVAVTRALRAAIARIERVDPELGRYLSSTIRTGTCCTYLPDPRFPVRWRFSL